MRLGWRRRVEKGRGASKRVGTHRRGPRRVREVVAGAGAHEGRVGRIWDGGGTLRRGRACQRAKAEGGIDEKGVRGCGDGERGTSRQRWAGAAVFSARCRPHVPPRRCPNTRAPMVHPYYAPHAFRPPTALPYAFHAPHDSDRPRPSPTNPWPSPMHTRPFPTRPRPSPTRPRLPYASQPTPMHPTAHLWPRPCITQRALSSTPQLYPRRPDTHRHMTTHPAHTRTPSACRRPPTVHTSQPQRASCPR